MIALLKNSKIYLILVDNTKKGEIFMLVKNIRVNGNVMIIHGGGLVEPSKVILLKIAKHLEERKVYSKIFIGRYSFEALYTPMFWLEYNQQLEEELEDKRGTWFGTCRDINLTDANLMDKVIECMKANNIVTLIVAGGDGSARQCAEIQAKFEENDINIIFAIPLTVDGINGGECIGKDQAVREVIRQTENVVATSLETRDKGEYSVVVVETQGRNRDDIMANALMSFYRKQKIADVKFDKLNLIAVPANKETDFNALMKKINNSKMRTLIFLSEGSSIKISDINSATSRKVRSVVVGHQVQSNNLMTAEDEEEYAILIDKIADIIELNPLTSYSVVITDKKNNHVRKDELSYYAKLNPFEGQTAYLPSYLEDLVENFMA